MCGVLDEGWMQRRQTHMRVICLSVFSACVHWPRPRKGIPSLLTITNGSVAAAAVAAAQCCCCCCWPWAARPRVRVMAPVTDASAGTVVTRTRSLYRPLLCGSVQRTGWAVFGWAGIGPERTGADRSGRVWVSLSFSTRVPSACVQ